MCNAQRGQKKALDPLELALQVAMSRQRGHWEPNLNSL